MLHWFLPGKIIERFSSREVLSGIQNHRRSNRLSDDLNTYQTSGNPQSAGSRSGQSGFQPFDEHRLCDRAITRRGRRKESLHQRLRTDEIRKGNASPIRTPFSQFEALLFMLKINDDKGVNKNACYALSCLCKSQYGFQLCLQSITIFRQILLTMETILRSTEHETVWFALM